MVKEVKNSKVYPYIIAEGSLNQKMIITDKLSLFWLFDWEDLDESAMHIEVCKEFDIDDDDTTFLGYVEGNKVFVVDYRKYPPNLFLRRFSEIFPNKDMFVWNNTKTLI